MIYALIIITIINILLAKWDSILILKGKRILHGVNGAIYLLICGILFYIYRDWYLVAAALFNRLVFFNIPLSLFRKLDWDYISPNPKAILDQIAFFIFKYNGKLMYGVYFVLFIVAVIITFIK